MKKVLLAICAFVIGLMATGVHAQQGNLNPNADVYGRGNSMTMGNVFDGTVIDVRAVHIEAGNTANWTGRATGAALGGLLGSRVGNGDGQIAAGILGGVLGAVAGDMVADRVGGYDGTEIVVALATGRSIAVTQAGGTAFVAGMPVYVIQSGGTARVVPRHAASASRPMMNTVSRPAAH